MNKLVRLRSLAGYAFFFLFIFTFSLIITFPFGTLRTKMNLTPSIPVKFDLLGYSFPLGLRAENMRVVDSDGKQMFDVTYATARIKILQLFKLSPGVDLELKLPMGNLVKASAFDLAKKKKKLTVETKKFDLSKFEQLNSLGVTAGGLATIEGSASVTGRELSTGKAQIAISNFSLAKLPLGEFTLTNISLGDTKLNLEIDKQTITIRKLTSMGDLASDLSGSIKLGPTKDSSHIELRGKIKLSGKPRATYGVFIDAALGKPDTNGFQSISIAGPLSHPTIAN